MTVIEQQQVNSESKAAFAAYVETLVGYTNQLAGLDEQCTSIRDQISELELVLVEKEAKLTECKDYIKDSIGTETLESFSVLAALLL